MNSIRFQVFNREYIVGEPTIGQILEREHYRVAFSGGRYNQMLANAGGGTSIAIESIDALSALSAIAPTLLEQLKVNSYLDLSPTQTKDLVKVYRSTIKPFFEEIEKEWYSDPESEQSIAPENVEELKNS